MKFIADVNIAQKVIRLLRQSGHDVIDLKKLNQKTSDVDIIKLASLENLIILTHDKDFLGLTQYPKYQIGMIVIRPTIQNAEHHYIKLNKVLKKYKDIDLINSLTIIYEESIEVYPYEL